MVVHPAGNPLARLAPPQISEIEIKLAETERALVPLQAKKQELTKLLQQKLAPTQSLEQVNRDLKLMEQERAVLQSRLRQERPGQFLHRLPELLDSRLVHSSLSRTKSTFHQVVEIELDRSQDRKLEIQQCNYLACMPQGIIQSQVSMTKHARCGR